MATMLEGEGELTFHFTIAGAAGDVVVTQGLIVDEGFVEADFLTIVGDWDNVVTAACTADAVCTQADLIVNPDGTEVFYTTTVSFVGGQGTSSTPPNVALLVKKTTGLTGRRNQGRMFLPMLPEGAISDAGLVDPAYSSGVDTAFTTFRGACLSAGATPAVLHKAAHRKARPIYEIEAEPATPMPEGGFQVQGKVATQRGRLRD